MTDKNAFNPDLDPEVIKVRDKIISKIGDKPLEEVNTIIKKLLNESMDDVTRLGALAARLKIIRSKIELLYESKVEIKPRKAEKKVDNTKIEKKEEKDSNEKWIRIKMLEAGEVNGKQIDKGVILDVKEEDGKKLLDSKKAELVEAKIEGAAPIQKSEKITPEDHKTEDKKEDKKDEKKEESKSDTSEIKKDEKEVNVEKDEEQKVEAKESKSKEINNSEENSDSNTDDSKPKNLLEKHEDAVSDDDKSTENKHEVADDKKTEDKPVNKSEQVETKENEKQVDEEEKKENESNGNENQK